jgi:peptidoglycan/xylan/chitin deacetylase (PgdA/CDA1 family)
MRESIKHLLGRTFFATGLDSALLGHAAVVVTFHRVRDSERADGLTIDVRAFERYCRFFRRHFRVVPLRDIVKRLERGETLNRELAITFDDGYRDNFENAAPILERLSLPATFFVVTQWIGTDVVPWWDRTDGVAHPWMTWEQVRALRTRGFDIGSHTRTHVDLGRADAVDAYEEIAGGRRELEDKLGEPVDLFAYPYGRQDNLADANRSLVRRAGFRCCCSCYGGVITGETDPFNIARVPVTSRYASPHRFALEVALGRSVIPA